MISPASRHRWGVAVVTLVIGLALPGVWVGAADTVSSETVDLPTPALCFAPGTPPDKIAEAYERAEWSFKRHSLAPAPFLKYEIDYRWWATATDGSGLSQGDPMTLTWSVVPDGTTIPAEFGYPGAPSNIRAFLNGIYGNEATWLALFQQVFDRWAELTGITYVYEPNDDGVNLSGLGGVIGVRGDIRIGGKLIDGGPGGILAYNYYPTDGDMVIDTGDSFYTNITGTSIRFRNTVAHEHGHGLGFDHVCPMNQTKLMEPYLTTLFDGPQHDDILAANRFYGDRFEHDETTGTAASLGSFSSTTETNLSIDDNSDVDIYSFIAGASTALDVTLTPTGATYLSGPQETVYPYNCTAGSSFNSLVVHDLAVRVLDANGSTELAEADLSGAGQSEVLEDVVLTSGAGTYFIEVTGDSTDSAQLYQLSLTISSSTHIFSDGFQSGGTSSWSNAVP